MRFIPVQCYTVNGDTDTVFVNPACVASITRDLAGGTLFQSGSVVLQTPLSIEQLIELLTAKPH